MIRKREINLPPVLALVPVLVTLIDLMFIVIIKVFWKNMYIFLYNYNYINLYKTGKRQFDFGCKIHFLK